MTDMILVLNSGSSSIKFALYESEVATEVPAVSGKIENIGNAPSFSAYGREGAPLHAGDLARIKPGALHDALIGQLLGWVGQLDTVGHLAIAGHRVVHGGRVFSKPTLLTPEVIQDLEDLVSLAPLHQPHNLAAIQAISAVHPDLPQIACFDTGFHRSQPRLNHLFALPRELIDAGILRYGFHGLSYEYIAGVLPDHLGDQADGRVIVAHLGSGASMCAMHARQSVATTMGFTALHGLVMGRRSGTLDCGVVLHLMQHMAMSAAQIQHLLYEESGLLGVSGLSDDMRILLESSDPHAREAVDLFCYRAACELASLVVPLGGLDAIVFTAGIGEHAAEVRRRICAQLGWLGVTLDNAANQAGDMIVSAASSSVRIHVIPTNEELVIARAASAMSARIEDRKHRADFR
jgi:acetate kinase